MSEILFQPTAEQIASAQLTDFARQFAQVTGENLTSPDYLRLHQASLAHVESFWQTLWQWANVAGSRGETALTQRTLPGAQWFPEGELNFADNLMRVGRAEQTAIIARCETRPDQHISYQQLRQQVMRLAAYLKHVCGVEPGDRVCAYLGNTPEALIGMLATSYLGATWSSASPDFGFEGTHDRFGQIEPKVMLAGNGYGYGGKRFDRRDVVTQLREAIPSIEHVISVAVRTDLPGHDDAIDFLEALANDHPDVPLSTFPFNHPLYILFSSGTTGKPKCIVHGAGGTLLQHIKELRLHGDISAESVFFYFTTTGWMMWNWLASGLVTGATLVLFDGNPMYPGHDALWRLASEYKVTHFGTSAKYLASCRKLDVEPPVSQLESLHTIFSTGSPLADDDFHWVYQTFPQPLRLQSISGGTDIVSCFVGGNPWSAIERGKIQGANLAMAVEAWNDDGQAVTDERGELVCTLPAPCMPIGFWRDEGNARYQAAYFERFPGVWAHGDFCSIDAKGQVVILGRSDTTLNPGGVRIGTAEIYRQVETLEAIADSLVVGRPVNDDVEVVLFVVTQSGVELTDTLIQQIKTTIRNNTTPRHVPKHVVAVPAIPYTRSGKKVELAVTEILRGDEPKNLTALANAEALDAFRTWAKQTSI